MAAKYKASDLHLKTGASPYLRIHASIRSLDIPPLTPDTVKGLVYSMLMEEQIQRFENTGDLDLAYSMDGVGRFRVNVFRQRGTISAALRRVNTDIPTFEELNLPVKTMEKLSSYMNGLIIVSGVTGSGKSTTLASMIEYINTHRKCHIVTIEDPIEYLHKDNKAFINQREVGIDVESYHTALKYVVRQDPDVILIGELRDEESFQAGLSASETGHLVFGTLHSSTCAQTFSRILDLFPSNRQDQIRQGMVFNLRAIMSQRLLPAKDEKIKAVPAVEILIANPILRKVIGEKEDEKITDIIRGGTEEGMQDFTQSLCNLVKSGLVEKKIAMAHAPQPEALQMLLQGIKIDEGRTIVGV
jgi:twitching motility protein PilT